MGTALRMRSELDDALLRVVKGLHDRGVMLSAPSRAAALEHTASPLAAAERDGARVARLRGSTRVRTRDVIELLTDAGVRTEYWDHPHGLSLDGPVILMIENGDVLSGDVWRLLLQVMKRCSGRELPLLVVCVTIKDRSRLLGRLFSLDGDSCMMWTTETV